jgi:hypothetical protein
MAIGKIAPAQRTVVNQTPLNQRNTRWAEIQPVNAPHPDTDAATFGYWFNYFWEEARKTGNLTPGDQGRLCDAFFTVFDKDATGVRVKPTFNQLTDDKMRTILTTLLVIGFKRVPLEGVVPAARTHLGRSNKVVAIERAVDCLDLQIEVAGARLPTLKDKVPTSGSTLTIGFRGDGRSYEDLVTAGGFKARARSKGQDVYKWFGFDKPWHPFGLKVYKKSLFLRKGQNKDNCLHTVVSVGFEFKELVTYPLLTDAGLFPLCQKPLNTWTQKEIGEAVTHKWKVRTVPSTSGNGALDHIEHELRIYVVRMDLSRGFDTSAWQKKMGEGNPFPEVAVDQVTISNILAEIVLTRRYYHPGKVGYDFEMYDLEFKSVRLLPSETILKIRFGDPFPAMLMQRINALEREAKAYRSDAKRNYEKSKQAAAPVVVAKKGNCKYCGKPVAALTIHERDCSQNPAKKKTAFALPPPPTQ